MIEGTDPALKDQYVVLSAHYDHLGVRNGVLYPGADDNASSVAMMLEVARSIVEGERSRNEAHVRGVRPGRGRPVGSRYFVQHPPVPLDRIALFMTADLLGRSLGGVCGPFVFVIGSETSPALRPVVEKAADGEPMNVGLLGADLLVLDRSDYGPFRAKKVPYLFFSCGESPPISLAADVPETLDYPKAGGDQPDDRADRPGRGGGCRTAGMEAAGGAANRRGADDPRADADAVRASGRIEDQAGRGAVDEADAVSTRRHRRARDDHPAERRAMVRAAQIVLFTVL